MTVKIKIDVTGHPTRIIGCSTDGLEAIRLTFNPSLNDDVTTLKALAAAFITHCDTVTRRQPWAARELAVAKTNMQTASMWSVLGATKANDDNQVEKSNN